MAEDKSKDKGERYDRQLRLWGQDGQGKLESAKILCLTASVTASEALKDLVLPGIGSFTLMDGADVTQEDLGNHFFVDSESLGQKRAEVVTRLLLELNPFVTGTAVVADPNVKMVESPEFVDQFTMVIATQLSAAALSKVAARCAEKQIPLLVARCYGLLGVVRLQSNEHQVLDAKPNPEVEDMRLNQPFAELRAFAEKFDLSKMDNHEHSHLPYPVLLIKLLDEWRKTHDNKPPTTRAEKDEFKSKLKAMSRDHSPIDENVNEALKAAYKALSPPSIPRGVAEILSDEKAANPPKDSDFWCIIAGMKVFVDTVGEGCLPLQGGIPDMHADTNRYIELQNVYVNKANADVKAVAHEVGKVCSSLGRPAIAEESIKEMCKNAHAIGLIRYHSIADELAADDATKKAVAGGLDNEGNHLRWYVLLRAVDHFFSQHKRYPGVFDDEVAGDTKKMSESLQAVAAQLGIEANKIEEKLVAEIVRAGAVEMHAMASFIGGVVAQEVLKLTTNKWTPFNNTFIFDGAAASGATLVL